MLHAGLDLSRKIELIDDLERQIAVWGVDVRDGLAVPRPLSGAG
jgi:hypothetical protein